MTLEYLLTDFILQMLQYTFIRMILILLKKVTKANFRSNADIAVAEDLRTCAVFPH